MSLIDTVLADDPDAPTVREAVQARQRYLWARAEALGTREGAPEPPLAMEPASLWMEACETAAFAGELRSARLALREASQALAALGNPFGESLRTAFLPGAPREAPVWRELLEGVAAEGSPLAWALFNEQQRHLASGEGPDETLIARLPGEPRVGRLGWTPATLLGQARWGRAEREAFAVHALARQWEALQSAQRNRYLWRQMLAPVALFDLELAVLLRHGLAPRGEGLAGPWLSERLRDAPARRFAQAYLDTVGALMEREPDEGERAPVLQGQR